MKRGAILLLAFLAGGAPREAWGQLDDAISALLILGQVGSVDFSIPGPGTPLPSREIRPSEVIPYLSLIQQTARRYEVDPALLTALVRAESGFQPRAVSNKGAIGLLQLMPVHAEGRRMHPAALLQPAINLEIGAAHFSMLWNRHHGKGARRLDFVLADWNWGPANVQKQAREDRWPAETRQLIARVKRFQKHYARQFAA
jgi:soluble lytic murein transglycosylase-like protein